MTITNYIKTPAIKLLLFVFYVQSYVCYKLLKLFEKCLLLFLQIPNDYLAYFSTFSKIVDTKGNPIKIINVITEHGDITNKLKIFLLFYYELACDENATDNNGFSFIKLQQFISCSMLYCSYVVMYPTEDPSTFIEKLKHFQITTKQTNRHNIYEKSNINNEQTIKKTEPIEIPFGFVDFD
jgi:hypothetical protein